MTKDELLACAALLDAAGVGVHIQGVGGSYTHNDGGKRYIIKRIWYSRDDTGGLSPMYKENFYEELK